MQSFAASFSIPTTILNHVEVKCNPNKPIGIKDLQRGLYRGMEVLGVKLSGGMV